MADTDEDERWVRRVAAWLPRLAERATMDEAARALFEIRIAQARNTSVEGERRVTDEDAVEREVYDRALRRDAPEFDRLIPAWIERFLEALQKGWRARAGYLKAIRQDDNKAPAFAFDDILALGELER